MTGYTEKQTVEHLNKLDEIIENPTILNQDQKVNLIARATRANLLLNQVNYNNVELAKKQLVSIDERLFGSNQDGNEGIVYKIEKQSENINQQIMSLDNILFGSPNKKGKIYQLEEDIHKINVKMSIVVWIGSILAGAIILNIMGNILSIPELQSRIISDNLLTIQE